jgi:hypothetical protein
VTLADSKRKEWDATSLPFVFIHHLVESFSVAVWMKVNKAIANWTNSEIEKPMESIEMTPCTWYGMKKREILNSKPVSKNMENSNDLFIIDRVVRVEVTKLVNIDPLILGWKTVH